MKADFLTTTALAATAATALILTPVPEAQAGLIDYQGTATVDWATPAIQGDFQPGDLIDFQLSIDLKTPDSEFGNDALGRYDHAASIAYNIGPHTIFDMNADITIINDEATSYPDTIFIDAMDPLAFLSSGLPALDHVEITFEDPTQTALDSDALIPGIMDFNAYSVRDVFFLFSDYNMAGATITEFHEVTTPAVPVPATLALIGIGLAGLGAARGRNKDTDAPSTASAQDANTPAPVV